MVSMNPCIREGDGKAVVALRGELDVADAASVAAALVAVAAPAPEIIVDLAGLGFIDSRGVAARVVPPGRGPPPPGGAPVAPPPGPGARPPSPPPPPPDLSPP